MSSSVDAVLQSLPQVLGGGGRTLSIHADPELSRSLRIGDVLSGRVLRHFDGHRYLVHIGGEERVVDSEMALRTDEIVHGRVVGLDEKVHLQRVRPAAAEPRGNRGLGVPSAPVSSDRAPGDLEALFSSHGASLGEADRASLSALTQRAARPLLVSLAGLLLAKMGLKLDPTLVQALARALEPGGLERNLRRSSADVADALRLATGDAGTPDAGARAADALGPVLRDAIRGAERERLWPAAREEAPEGAANAPGGVGGGGREVDRAGTDAAAQGGAHPRSGVEWRLGRLLLNAQHDGSVSHRLTTFPIWFGDQLVEVSLAMFSQREETVKPGGIRYRRILIGLDVEGLGRVEIRAAAADRSLRLQIGTEHEAATAALARHLGALSSAVAAAGWQVDELDYVTLLARDDSRPEPVVSAVVEHHVTPDSLNRVM